MHCSFCIHSLSIVERVVLWALLLIKSWACVGLRYCCCQFLHLFTPANCKQVAMTEAAAFSWLPLVAAGACPCTAQMCLVFPFETEKSAKHWNIKIAWTLSIRRSMVFYITRTLSWGITVTTRCSFFTSAFSASSSESWRSHILVCRLKPKGSVQEISIRHLVRHNIEEPSLTITNPNYSNCPRTQFYQTTCSIAS